jgi:hypothetical protein
MRSRVVAEMAQDWEVCRCSGGEFQTSDDSDDSEAAVDPLENVVDVQSARTTYPEGAMDGRN